MLLTNQRHYVAYQWFPTFPWRDALTLPGKADGFARSQDHVRIYLARPQIIHLHPRQKRCSQSALQEELPAAAGVALGVLTVGIDHGSYQVILLYENRNNK